MKRLSGDLLSRLLNTLYEANQKNVTKEQLTQLIEKNIVSVEDLYIELKASEQKKKSLDSDTVGRKSLIATDSLDKLNVLLPWCSYAESHNGNLLGTAWSERKRSAVNVFPDPLVKKFANRIDLDGLSILEVGCFEGHHTSSLAHYAADVWAFDGRIENTIKTLVRCWLMGLEHKTHIECIDIEKASVSDTLKKLGRSKNFDMIYHRGVLYHLSDPVAHLLDSAKSCDKHFYLHTQIASSEQATEQYNTEIGNFPCFRYKEPKVAISPFSGMTPGATWLTKEGLLKTLEHMGFSKVEIYSEIAERNGPRIELLASR